jgi:hypothetical protein
MSEGVCRSEPAYVSQIDTPPDARVAATAAEQHGVISTRQLRACGLGSTEVSRRVRGGRLHRVHRGVYAVGHPALTLTGRFVAAVHACGNAASLSHFACGAYWEFMRWEDRLIDVTVIGTTTRRVPGVRVHRSRSLDERDILRRDGMRVTSPARTLLDLAAVLPPKALRRAARQAQAERRVNIRQLAEILERSNGHRGVPALRAIIDDLLDLLDRAKIERPEVNAPLHVGGRSITPDYLWRERRIAIEADSRRWHDDPLTHGNDTDKQAILEANDYRVLRITDHQIDNHPQQTLARIRAALAGS